MQNVTWVTITSPDKETDLHVRFETNAEQHYIVGLSAKGQERQDQDAFKSNSLEDIVQWWINSETRIDESGLYCLPESSSLVEVW
jgi:hypothetical protein